ncbi:MAG: hypothetical protein L0K08_07235 [Bifidobacterium mongoliense]|nr:hypothetical protein [Bifidobacterium mongoliense]
MPRRERLAVWLVVLAVVIVHRPLPGPIVLALVLATGATALWATYSTPKEKP